MDRFIHKLKARSVLVLGLWTENSFLILDDGGKLPVLEDAIAFRSTIDWLIEW